jgi:hypothetical protein
VVRAVATGRIHKLLDEVTDPEQFAQGAARRAAQANPKVIVPIVLTALALGVGAAVVIRKRMNADGVNVLTDVTADAPECVSNFEASLRAYVEAGPGGLLNAAIVDQLIVDLDKVKEWADAGNSVALSLEQLEPLFNLVIGHTPALAKAYSVALTDFEHPDSDGETGVVVQLREHLDMQKKILGEAA